MATETPAPASPDPEAPAVDSPIDQLLHALSVIRRRWLAVALTTATMVAAALVAITLLTPRWRAETTLLAHRSGPHVLDKIQGVSDDSNDRRAAYEEFYKTQLAIIESQVVAERALEKLGLASDPVFLGVDDLAAAADIDPVERLREWITVREVRKSHIIRISVDYPDAALAPEIVNAVAAAYLDFVEQTRTRVGKTAKENVGIERDTAMADLRAAERAIAAFKREHGIGAATLADRQRELSEGVMTTKIHLKTAEAERHRAEARFRQAQRMFKSGGTIDSGLLSGADASIYERVRQEQLAAEREVGKLSVRYGDKMPDVREARSTLQIADDQLTTVNRETLRSLKAVAASALDAEAALRGTLEREEGEAIALMLLERQYQELERAVRTAADTYALVSRRYTEIDLTNRMATPSIEVLDPAKEPLEPSFPPVTLLLAAALLCGLGVGSVVALAIDHRDLRIRGLPDLETALADQNLQTLGQLPQLQLDARLGLSNARAQRRQRDLFTHLFPRSLMAERCRAVRTSLSFAQAGDAPHTLMITSPNIGEGKSSAAINLALSFCQAGKRVLLVDADLRRPRLHDVFAAPGESPGLSAALRGEAEVDDVIVSSGEGWPEHLSVLPSGESPQNPADLLDSARCRALLAALKRRFDVVLLDTPPVLLVTDPVVLAGMVDGVLLVARCNLTTQSELRRAVVTLRGGVVNLMGVILNEVEERSRRGADKIGEYAYYMRELDQGARS